MGHFIFSGVDFKVNRKKKYFSKTMCEYHMKTDFSYLFGKGQFFY